MKTDNEIEEKLLTLECVMAELGYRTVRNSLNQSLQVIVGEIRIICDEVELVKMSETYDDFGYIANLLCNGLFIASVNRWT